jgi:hypothetical protein
MYHARLLNPYQKTIPNPPTNKITAAKATTMTMTLNIGKSFITTILILTSVLAGISLPLSAEEEIKKPLQAKLLLSNGDKLSGTPKFINAQQLALDSAYLNEPATFDISQILSIQIDQESITPTPEIFTRIQLQNRNQETNGDTLIGQLKELNEDEIKLDTQYSETLTLKRSMVQSLNIVSKRQGHYRGPNSIHEWQTSTKTPPEANGSWRLKNHRLEFKGTNEESIGKDIGLRKKSQISFDLTWETHMNLQLQLYSSDVKSTTPSACYQLKFDSYAVFMMTRTKGKELDPSRQRFAERPSKKEAHFDVCINRETGIATIYINGKQACIIQSPIPEPDDLGTGLTFISHRMRPITISNIHVSPWNGIPLGKLARDQANNDLPTEAKQPHNIILMNGDSVPCTVGVIQDGRMIVNTKHTPIRIPIEKIKSINWEDKREEPKKYKGDIRAWFHHGGFITLKLASITEDKLSGYSQALGDVSIDLAAFSKIDFNIYNANANELRQKHAEE